MYIGMHVDIYIHTYSSSRVHVLVLVFTVIRVIVGCPYSYMFWSQLSVRSYPSLGIQPRVG